VPIGHFQKAGKTFGNPEELLETRKNFEYKKSGLPPPGSRIKNTSREGMLNGFFTPLCPTSLLRNSCPMVCTSVFNYFLIHCRSLLLYFPPAFLVCRWYPEFFSSPRSGCADSLFTEKVMQFLFSDHPILQIY
jgi:hypothetical protein